MASHGKTGWRALEKFARRIKSGSIAAIRSSLFVGLSFSAHIQTAAAQPKFNWSAYSKVGHWDIWKGPAGCAATTQTLNDLLALQVGKDHGAVSIINSAMEIPPGRYPVGFKLGPPNDFDGEVQAVVAADTPHKVTVSLPLADMTKVAGAGWVKLTLGSHEHFVNTGDGINAVRVLKICEATATDPFKHAGGGLIP